MGTTAASVPATMQDARAAAKVRVDTAEAWRWQSVQ
jgi:hypothetical protein